MLESAKFWENFLSQRFKSLGLGFFRLLVYRKSLKYRINAKFPAGPVAISLNFKLDYTFHADQFFLELKFISPFRQGTRGWTGAFHKAKIWQHFVFLNNQGLTLTRSRHHISRCRTWRGVR